MDLLNNNIIPHLRVEFNDRFDRLWWAQDGAPAHRRIIVREFLAEVFNNRVIGLGHEHEWPPRSPDLTPCDYFLWGYVKSKVFISPPSNLNDLRNKIIAVFAQLKQNQQFIINAVLAMKKRARVCVRRNGEHVEGDE